MATAERLHAIDTLLRESLPTARGGVWPLAARQRFEWPAALHVPDPPAPVPARAPPAGCAGVAMGWLRRGKPPVAPRQPLPDELDRWLITGEASIARNNLEKIGPWFTPFWNDAPAELAAISEQGLLWVLAVRRLRERGPEHVDDVLAEIPPDADLASRTTAGDCAAIHFLIEDLIAELPPMAGFTVRPSSIREPGGLRAPETLRNVPALRAHAAEWARAIDALVARSPLTQLVYTDLFDAGRDPAAFAALFRSPKHDPSMELWISHLARSLIAACASPAPSEELRLDALAAVQREAEAPESIWSLFRRRPRESPRDRFAAEEARCRTEYGHRIASMGALTGGSLHFHVRFLDMLVRRIAVECSEEIVRGWQRNTDRLAEPRLLFFLDPGNVCQQRFETWFWRTIGAPGPLRETMATGWRAFDVRSLDPEQIALGSGIGGDAARALQKRFTTDPIALPLRNHWGFPPFQVWSRWYTGIANRVAEPETGAAAS